jgi:hypothetical protein
MTHQDEEAQAREVILAMRKLLSEIDAITNAIGDKRSIDRELKEDLQNRLTLLKGSLKAAAKRGTVDPERSTQNEIERLYFSHAVFAASANLHIAVNSHPINSDWFGALYSIRIDIDHPLHQLEQQYPGI